MKKEEAKGAEECAYLDGAPPYDPSPPPPPTEEEVAAAEVEAEGPCDVCGQPKGVPRLKVDAPKGAGAVVADLLRFCSSALDSHF